MLFRQKPNAYVKQVLRWKFLQTVMAELVLFFEKFIVNKFYKIIKLIILAPRSGLAVKHFIDVGAGVIDSDYRGEVLVLLFNFGDQLFEGFFVLSYSIKILKINLVKKEIASHN